MANVLYNGVVVGELLVDPSGTNMGVNWNSNIDPEVKKAAWDIFMSKHPTGQKIENKDLSLASN